MGDHAFGARLRERRLAAGLRQGDLALRLGISPSYLNLIEHGRRRISKDLLIQFARALGLDPADLAEGQSAGLADELRQAGIGAAVPGLAAESAEDFARRFPAWAELTSRLYRQTLSQEAALAAALDRMRHDPFLPDTLHEVLSAATSVLSSSEILSETKDLEPDWRARFEANLQTDTRRLARLTEGLASHLEAEGRAAARQGGAGGMALAQDEAESWAEAQGWDLSAPLDEAAPISAAARSIWQGWQGRDAKDRAQLPEAQLKPALAPGGDPARLAQSLELPVPLVLRRLALRAGSGLGLVTCDAAGSLTLRKALPGFALPRAGAGCALWPLFGALSRPHVPLRVEVRVQSGAGAARGFRLWAYGQIDSPGGFGGAVLASAHMLIEPLSAPPAAEAPEMGPSCRICRAQTCPARREPSVLGA